MQVTGAAREGDSSAPAWEPSTGLAQAVAPPPPSAYPQLPSPQRRGWLMSLQVCPAPRQQQQALERESECRLGAPPHPLNQGRGGGAESYARPPGTHEGREAVWVIPEILGEVVWETIQNRKTNSLTRSSSQHYFLMRETKTAKYIPNRALLGKPEYWPLHGTPHSQNHRVYKTVGKRQSQNVKFFFFL